MLLETTITNNTTLPSGSTSSGTITNGKYVKFGKGYNAADKYYLAEANTYTSYTPSSTYFQTSTTGAVTGAKIEANKYATSAYYVKSMTLPTAASTSSSGTTKATIGRSTSDQYINIPTGYNTAAANYKISAVPNGSATTPPTTKQQSQPTFSKSGDVITANVAATSVSVTPTVSAGYVSSGTAGTVTMSANSNTYTIPTETRGTSNPITANGTYTPSSGKYFTSVTVAIPEYTDLS